MFRSYFTTALKYIHFSFHVYIFNMTFHYKIKLFMYTYIRFKLYYFKLLLSTPKYIINKMIVSTIAAMNQNTKRAFI